MLRVPSILTSDFRSPSATDTVKKEASSDSKDASNQGSSTLQPCSLMVDMEEDYMEGYPIEEGEDTDEFEDIENEDENDPDDLFERTLEVSLFYWLYVIPLPLLLMTLSFCEQLLCELAIINLQDRLLYYLGSLDLNKMLSFNVEPILYMISEIVMFARSESMQSVSCNIKKPYKFDDFHI